MTATWRNIAVVALVLAVAWWAGGALGAGEPVAGARPELGPVLRGGYGLAGRPVARHGAPFGLPERTPRLSRDWRRQVPRRGGQIWEPQMAWTTVSIDALDLHWATLLPGTYAAPMCRITVASTEPVTLVVGSECSDLTAPSGRVIPTWYAFGDTIQEAEASGWIPAGELPGMTFPTLFSQPTPEGRIITIWCRIKTDSAPAEDGFCSSFELTICPSP